MKTMNQDMKILLIVDLGSYCFVQIYIRSFFHMNLLWSPSEICSKFIIQYIYSFETINHGKNV